MCWMAQSVTGGAVEVGNPFATDSGDELPVCVQIGWRLGTLIATGRLPAGSKLPSYRRLAEWAGVNVNTVRLAYSRLEEKGLVVTRQGQGTFVAEGVEPAPELEQIAGDALRRAREAGLDPRDLAIVLSACASIPVGGGEKEAVPDATEDAETLEVRRELRRQIERLEAELATYAHDLPGDMPTAPRRARAHIAGVAELEQTRDTLISQLSAAQRAAEERARIIGRERAERRRAAGESLGAGAPGAAGGSPLERAMSWWQRKL